MIKTIDISNIAQENHDYAVHLATHQNILTYKNEMFVLDLIPEKDTFKAVVFGVTSHFQWKFYSNHVYSNIRYLSLKKEPMVNMETKLLHLMIHGSKKRSKL